MSLIQKMFCWGVVAGLLLAFIILIVVLFARGLI